MFLFVKKKKEKLFSLNFVFILSEKVKKYLTLELYVEIKNGIFKSYKRINVSQNVISFNLRVKNHVFGTRG